MSRGENAGRSLARRRAPRAKDIQQQSEAGIAAEAPSSAQARIMALLVGLVSFFVYASTMATSMQFRTLVPGVYSGDGIELASAAYVLGVPHPTGYPLYMLVLKAFSLLPLRELIARTTLANVLFAACAAALSARIILDVLGKLLQNWNPKALLILSASIALTGAFLRFHWENAVITEVYALEFLLMLLFVRSAQLLLETWKTRYLLTASLWLGLGLVHHRLSVCMGIPYLLLWAAVWMKQGAGALGQLRSSMLKAAGILAACLALYLYLPLRAAAHPPINWGDPSSPARLVHHVRGGEYMQYRLLQVMPGQPFTAATYSHFAGLLTGQLARDFVGQLAGAAPTRPQPAVFGSRLFLLPTALGAVAFLLLGALAAWGLWGLCRRQPWLGAVVVLAAAQNLVVIYLYNIADVSDYYLFAFWLGWIGIVLGAAELLGRARQKAGWQRLVSGEAAYAFMILPLVVALCNWGRVDQSSNSAAEDYSYTILPQKEEIMPKDSILLTDGDVDIYTSWYRQLVRKERQDVLVFGANFIHQPWYRTFFTPEQVKRYGLEFADQMPMGVDQFTDQVARGVIDKNLSSHAIFTSAEDQAFLESLSKRYDVRLASRQVIANPDSLLEETSATLVNLYRISPKAKTP